jgi:hypothetical protein
MFDHVARHLTERDPPLAAAWVESQVADQRVRANVIGQVAGKWAERDPASAAAWVDRFRETELLDEGTTYQLARSWANHDTNAAFDWADSLDPDLRRGAYGGIVERMPEGELEETGDWIRRAPVNRAMDGARTAYAWRIFEDRPAEALEHVQQLEDPQSLEQYLVPLAQKIYHIDPNTLEAWLPESGLSPGARQRVLQANPPGRAGKK